MPCSATTVGWVLCRRCRLRGDQGVRRGLQLRGCGQATVYAVAHEYAVSLVEAAGGTVASDLLGQIGVMVVQSPSRAFARDDAGLRRRRGGRRGLELARLPTRPGNGPQPGGGGPEPGGSAREPAVEHAADPDRGGARDPGRLAAVDVGILDSGIDGQHLDFDDDGVAGGSTNVDCCARPQLRRRVAARRGRRHAGPVRRQPVPRDARRRDRRRAGQRLRRRRRRAQRDARSGQGLRRDRLLLRSAPSSTGSPTRGTRSST